MSMQHVTQQGECFALTTTDDIVRERAFAQQDIGRWKRDSTMVTLDELEQAFRADPGLADLLAALDRSAAAVAAAGLTADDLLDDLPAIRAQVVRATYGDAFMDELHHAHEALHAAGTLVVPDHDVSGVERGRQTWMSPRPCAGSSGSSARTTLPWRPSIGRDALPPCAPMPPPRTAEPSARLLSRSVRRCSGAKRHRCCAAVHRAPAQGGVPQKSEVTRSERVVGGRGVGDATAWGADEATLRAGRRRVEQSAGRWSAVWTGLGQE
jgi:hypothetical protein